MNKDIAIIGMSGRFPFAENIASFYENLRNGRDCVQPISGKRMQDCALPSNDYQILGYLEDIDKFDYDFFGISKGEAIQMDPHQRLVMELTYELIQSAGYSIDHLKDSKTGFFLSCPPSSYENYLREPNASARIGNLNSMIPGRVARHFNLKGNALLIDTTCSSSLVSIVMACQQMWLAEADQMIVCGANLILFPLRKDSGSDFKIVSSSGKAKSFAEGADGTGVGEAVACVMLKPLEKAVSDGDFIHAVIKSGAINQDADRSSFLTAPSKVAQTEVIKVAWEKAQIDPITLGHIEAHGTGTVLGDPIEFDGVNDAFRYFTDKENICGLSSVKSNIGHTNHAAGLCGLIKTVLALKHQELFPSLHINSPNPHISLEKSAVFLNTKLKKWDTEHGVPRRAGVSSFGISGTNCHLVVEEAPQPLTEKDTRPSNGETQLLSFSAKTEESLMRYLGAFGTYVENCTDEDLPSIGYTLNCRRDSYKVRYSLCVTCIEGLKSKLSHVTDVHFESVDLEPKLFFLFSDAVLAPASVLDQYPFFKSYGGGRYEDRSLNGKNLLFQYLFFKKLEQSGLSSDNLLGIGLGEITISVILGEISLTEGMNRAKAYLPIEEENLQERVKKYINSEANGKKLIFLEIGAKGKISDLLRQQFLSKSVGLEVMTSHPVDEVITAYIKTAYLAGYPIHWDKMYQGMSVEKMELPTYQFEKIPCWPEVLPPATSMEVKDSFYFLDWIKEDLKHSDETVKTGCYLILADSEALYEDLTKTLINRGNQVVLVHLSNQFERLSKDEYCIDTQSPLDYSKLDEYLREEKMNLSGIIHLSSCFLPNDNEQIEQNFEKGIYAMVYLVQSFYHHFFKRNFKLLAVTSQAFQISDGDKINLSSVALAAFFKALVPEYPTMNIRTIDIHPDERSNLLSAVILDEVEGESQIRFVGIRKGQRYVQNLRRRAIESGLQDGYPDRGNYIVTGGASGVGFQMASSIAALQPAVLVILGRTVFPPKASWETYVRDNPSDDFSVRIKNLMSLEAMGPEIAYFSLDISDEEEVLAVAEKIRRDYGSVEGVLHSAGVKGAAQSIVQMDIALLKQTLAPKVSGTLHLLKMCSIVRAKRLIINSSLNAVFPQRNSVDYTVANAVVDAIASNSFSDQFQCMSINWPGWRETGMSLGSRGEQAPVDTKAIFGTLSNREGLEAFHLALSGRYPNVIIAPGDIGKIHVNPFFRLKTAGQRLGNKDLPKYKGNRRLETAEDIQQIIIQVWADVLQTESINPTDDFFDLGGHSLNGSQIINRFEKELAVEIEFETLLDCPTPEGLAKHIFEIRKAQPTVNLNKGIQPIPVQEYYDVSHGQKRLWAVSQMDDTQFAFNMPGAYFYKGVLDLSALETAFLDMISRHEILRTTFILIDDEIKQQIASVGSCKFSLGYIDYSEEDHAEDLVRQKVAEEAKRPFDLEKGPLLRVNVIKLKEEQHIIILVKHHIISDGWSMEVFIEELLAHYQAHIHGITVSLPKLKIQYKDYAAWQNEQLSGDLLSLHENYWLSRFENKVPAIDLKTDFARPKTKTYSGGNVISFLDKASVQRLNALSKKESCSSFMTLVALINTFIFLHTNEEDIVIGTPISGRVNEDLENQLGLYLNTLALRTKLSGGITFLQLLQETRKNCLEAFEHQMYPFDLLVEKLGTATDPDRSPLFDFMVMSQKRYRGNHQGLASGEVQYSAMDSYEVEVPISKYDLTFNFTESGDRLYINTEYNSDMYKRTSINLFNLQINGLLEQVLDGPDKALEKYSIQLDIDDGLSSSSSLDIDFDF